MTYTVHDPRTFIDAVISRLDSQTTMEIGDATKPSGVTYNPDGLPLEPYVVVYGGPDGDSTGTLNDPDADLWWTWTVTSIGGSRQQCAWAQNAVRDALVGWRPVVTGFGFGLTELAQGVHPDRDDDVQPPLFFAPDEFRVFASPD